MVNVTIYSIHGSYGIWFTQISPFAEALLQQLGLARGIPTVAVAQNLLRHHVLAVTG